jgi:hypothetical protein
MLVINLVDATNPKQVDQTGRLVKLNIYSVNFNLHRDVHYYDRSQIIYTHTHTNFQPHKHIRITILFFSTRRHIHITIFFFSTPRKYSYNNNISLAHRKYSHNNIYHVIGNIHITISFLLVGSIHTITLFHLLVSNIRITIFIMS